MSRWIARLSGHNFDLEDLPNWFNSDKMRITKEDGSFYLVSDWFYLNDSSVSIKRKALEVIGYINCVSKVKRMDFKPASLSSIYFEDENGIKSPYLDMDDRISISDGLKICNASETVPAISDLFQNDDEVILNVLQIWGQEPHDWSNFHKIIEWITCNDTKKETLFQNGIITREKYNLLKQTANSYEAIGDEARHAKGSGANPPENPMQIDEAERIIHSKIKAWLKYKGFSI
jgi:hypothetical protein